MHKQILIILFLFTFSEVFAQNNEPRLMTTTHYGEVIYSSAMTWDRVVIDLTADIYEPDREGQALRPLVIMVPDAYFTSSAASYEHWDRMANYIASCGYLVANIKYRQGMDPDIKVLLEDEFVKGITRSVQDIYAAVRYFREDAINGSNSYQIDPEKILLLGYSSGGMAVLHAAKYYLLDASTLRVDRLIKSVGGWHFNEKKDQLQEAIRGIAVIAGGVFDTLMMANHNRTPVVLFQAIEDSIVPRRFGDMQVAGLALGPLFGPEAVYNQLKRHQQRTELLTFEDTDHRFDDFELFEEIAPITVEFFGEALSMLPGGKKYARPPSGILVMEDKARRNELKLNIPADWGNAISLRVINGSNEQIFQKSEVFDQDIIDVQGWPNGMYIFKFSYGDRLKVIRYNMN